MPLQQVANQWVTWAGKFHSNQFKHHDDSLGGGGNFGVKMKIFFKIFRDSWLRLMLRSFLFIYLGNKKIFVELLRPFVCVNSDFFIFWGNFVKNFDFLTRMLWPLCARWAYGIENDACTERSCQELIRTLTIRHQFLTSMLSMHISFSFFQMFILCTSACAKGTDACAEHTLQKLTRARSI